MATLFEELMGTFRTEANTDTRNRIKENATKISTKNIRVESFNIFEDDDFDQETSFDVPAEIENGEEAKEGDVVLVIDPEVPADGEVPEDAAEKMVGDMIYKCPICAANYACDCESENSVVVCDEEGKPVECPVCGETTPQILVGIVSPADGEGNGEEVLEEPATDVEGGEETEEDFAGEEETETPEGEEEEVVEEEEEEKKEESLHLNEGDDCKCKNGVCKCPHCGKEIGEVEEVEELEECDKTSKKEEGFQFDDEKLVRLLKGVIKENYEHDGAILRVRKAFITGKNTLRLEYVLREGRTTTSGTMVATGFDRTKRTMTLKVRDNGVFTEKFSRKPAFMIECTLVKGVLTPRTLKYDYKTKVNENLYRVYGEVK